MSHNRDNPPFSNGTEYEIWVSRWCAQCVHEHPEFGGSCSDFDVAFIEDRVPDILEPADRFSWSCSKFRERLQ